MVLGLARSPENLLKVAQMGGNPVRGDVLDKERMERLFEKEKPEAVINLATAIPLKLRVNPADWEQNDRVRAEGTVNLLRTSEVQGVKVFLQESVGYICSSQGSAWMNEDSPLSSHPFLAKTILMEEQVKASHVPSAILRLGALLSADSWHTQQTVAAIRKGLLPILGNGEAYLSQIHAQDAGGAFLHLLDHFEKAQGQTWIAVEEKPATSAEIFPFVANLLKSPTPRRVPIIMARALVGAITIEVLGASYRLSSQKMREELGFILRYPSYRQIWEEIATQVAGKQFSFTGL